jgi:ankyrin repeat protein
MKLSKPFSSLLALALLSLSSALAFATNDADRQLLKAVESGSVNQVKQAIAAGANPDVYFGPRFREKPMCIATQQGFESVLLTLLEAGANANSLYTKTDILSEDPLSCAAHSRNLKAFKLLHEAGSEIDRDLCPDCSSKHPTPVLSGAIGGDRYDITRYIIENSDVPDSENRVIKQAIENSAVYADDKTLDDREWIADWLRARGMEVTPREPWPARR